MSLDRFRRPRMIILHPSSTAYDAARAMAEHRISTVLVGEGHTIVGIVTDRDLVLELMAEDQDPYTTQLREIMSSEVVTLDVSASLADVTQVMRKHACRRVPITEEGRPVGMVTLDDLLIDGEFSQGTRLAVAAQLDAECPERPRPQNDVAPWVRPWSRRRPRTAALA